MNLLYVAPEVEGAEAQTEEVEDVNIEVTDQTNTDAVQNPDNDNTNVVNVDSTMLSTSMDAPAPEPTNEKQPEAGSPWSFWIMIGAMILIMYFFMWRPERKRRKQMEQFRSGLKKGDKVITAGGIYGTIKEVHEASVLIEVDGNITLRVDKGMVVGDPSNGTAR